MADKDALATDPLTGKPPETVAEGHVPVAPLPAGVDPNHPALQGDHRKDTTAEQNRIHLNDPTITGEEQSRRNLAGTGGPLDPQA